MKTYFDYGAEFAEVMKEEYMGSRFPLQKITKPYPMIDSDMLEHLECEGMGQPGDEETEQFWHGYNCQL